MEVNQFIDKFKHISFTVNSKPCMSVLTIVETTLEKRLRSASNILGTPYKHLLRNNMVKIKETNVRLHSIFNINMEDELYNILDTDCMEFAVDFSNINRHDTGYLMGLLEYYSNGIESSYISGYDLRIPKCDVDYRLKNTIYIVPSTIRCYCNSELNRFLFHNIDSMYKPIKINMVNIK